MDAKLRMQYLKAKYTLVYQRKSRYIDSLKHVYKVHSDSILLRRLKPHPKSITIAQAAIESAWGTSRFFKKGKNIFGVWSFNKRESRIAASEKRGKKTIWMKKYKSYHEALYDYYFILARAPAFKEFRALKIKTSDPIALVKKLDRYSEKREVYCNQLISIIKYNKLTKYD